MVGSGIRKQEPAESARSSAGFCARVAGLSRDSPESDWTSIGPILADGCGRFTTGLCDGSGNRCNGFTTGLSDGSKDGSKEFP